MTDQDHGSRKPARIRFSAFALSLALAAFPGAALAIPSDVDSPAIEAGDTRLQQRTSLDPTGPGARWKHETSFSYAPTDWVSLQIGLEAAAADGVGLRSEGVELEAEFATPPLNAAALRLGFEIAHTVGFRDAPDDLALQAIAGARAGDLRWIANVIGERERGGPWTTEYGARLEGQIAEGVLLAGELLGDIDPGGGDRAAHVAGAAIRWSVGDLRIEPAAFIGLNSASPDMLFRLTLRTG
jgi:hypothetical protein